MSLNRRDFLRFSLTAGGGLLVATQLPGCASTPAHYDVSHHAWTANAWIEITEQNRVSFTLARVEMGQGTMTGLATLIAEELDVAPERIDVQFAPVDSAYINPLYQLQATGGSTSMAISWLPLRHAGASTRALLVAAAAQVWSVKPSDCTTFEGEVIHPNGSKRLSYSELAELASRLPMPDDIKLKSPAEFRYIGKHQARLDAKAKVTGSAVFGIDVELPGMVYAVVIRPPQLGGELASLDATKARTRPGVIDVFEISRGVAVVASSYWLAKKAAESVDVRWQTSERARLSSAGVMAAYAKGADDDAGDVERSDGDVSKAVHKAARVIEAEYRLPYLAHATMEPMNCTALVTDDRCEIWAPTQAPDMARIAAARATDFAPSDITVHTTFMGGGFGRRLMQDYVEEAAAISARLKQPVKLIWSREDDIQHDWYRPATLHRLRAPVDAQGNITGWAHQIVAPKLLDWIARDAAPAQYPWTPKMTYGMLAASGVMLEGIATPKDMSAIEGADDIPYRFPNVEVRHCVVDPGVPVSYWRSVGHSHNGFVIESFIDELADAAKQDPVAFRLSLLAGHDRHRQVLQLAAEKAGWGQPLPAGRFRGVALHKSFGSYAAQVVEASVDGSSIQVHRVVCAIDCGRVVNPDIVHMQMESGIIFGLSAALFGEITLDKGAVQQSNFHDYPVLRLHETPQIDVHLVVSDADPTGVGEPGVPPVAPALGNALFAATGQRLRQLPFRLKA